MEGFGGWWREQGAHHMVVQRLAMARMENLAEKQKHTDAATTLCGPATRTRANTSVGQRGGGREWQGGAAGGRKGVARRGWWGGRDLEDADEDEPEVLVRLPLRPPKCETVAGERRRGGGEGSRRG